MSSKKKNSSPSKEKPKKYNKIPNGKEDSEEEETYPIESEIRIGKYEEAPDYLKDNEYIKRGYLLNCHSIKLVLKSLFRWSNESLNVWTHLIGCLLAVIFIFYTGMYVKSKLFRTLSEEEFATLKTNVENTIIPWKTKLELDLSNYKETIKNFQFNYIDIILKKSSELLGAFNDKYKIINKIVNYIDNIRYYSKKVTSFFIPEKPNKIKEDLNEGWKICENKLFNYMQNDADEIYVGELQEDIKRWPLFIMLSAAIVCLGCSTIFHWFGSLNKKTFKLLSRFDYAGISFLIPGSCYPPYFYFYYCEQWIGKMYLAIITTLSVIVFVCTLTPDFHKPEKRRLRGTMFLALGVSTAFPIFHLALFGNHITGFVNKPYLIYWYLGGISYVLAGLFFVLRIPEKYFPYTFDYWGNSHNLLHTFVVLGFVLHYLGALDSYYYRLNNKCPVA